MKNLEKYEPHNSFEGGFMEEDLFGYDDADDEILDYFNSQQPLHLNIVIKSTLDVITVDLTALNNKVINLIITGESEL